MGTPNLLFNDPHIVESPDGDVLPSRDEVIKPLPKNRVNKELREDHPFGPAQRLELVTEQPDDEVLDEVQEIGILETEEDALGLKTSDVALQHRLSAETRVLGLAKIQEIRAERQARADAREELNEQS